MPPNYALQIALKDAAKAAGALEAALPDFDLDVQTFKITAVSEVEKWVEKCKVEKPHRFAVQSDHDVLAHRAFVLRNKTAEGQLYKSVTPQRFEELKTQWSNGIPEHAKEQFKDADHATNPWAATPANCNMKTGRYTDDAIKRQMSAVRGMGPEKAAQISAAVSAKLGDLYAPGFTNRGR